MRNQKIFEQRQISTHQAKKIIKINKLYILSLWFLFVILPFITTIPIKATGAISGKGDLLKFDNPFIGQYLKQHIRKNSPRLILTSAIERDLK